jgi:hypothetical protein
MQDQNDRALDWTKKLELQVQFSERSGHGSHTELVTKNDLREMVNRIMSAISEFASKQNAFNDRMDSAVDGLQADVTALNDKITQLQNNPGPITPEDQALLDQLQSRGETISTKLEALDALTPPTPPAA